MALSLYDVSVTSFLQTLTALEGVLAKGLAHCEAKGIDPGEIVETRIYPDMMPFRFQVQSAVFHSVVAIQGVKAGEVQPGRHMPDTGYAGLQKLVSDGRAGLASLKADEINALEGKDVVFKLGETALQFTAEGFLLSFSIPNLHFHATTAYDILRGKGVHIGKRDYIGRLRLKP
ncbi:MAG: DUF1993 family protein [Alphaproteobacteria bacterium]|nr:DUF1993 family protein [Alphaproteobacteria bacterium]